MEINIEIEYQGLLGEISDNTKRLINEYISENIIYIKKGQIIDVETLKYYHLIIKEVRHFVKINKIEQKIKIIVIRDR